jgi:polycomb protein EED
MSGSVAFHHDLILSKACREGKIVLWHIKNFSSLAPPPAPDKNPTTHDWKDTRSAFGDGFERLLQFKVPGEGNDPFYMRFDLFSCPGKHPVLAMGDMYGKVSLWDLTRLIDSGGLPASLANKAAKKGTIKQKKPVPKLQAARDDSVGSSAMSTNAVTDGQQDPSNPHPPAASNEYGFSDPFASIDAHAIVGLTKYNSLIRKVAWSVGGEWLVVCGEMGMLSVLRRWVDSGPSI